MHELLQQPGATQIVRAGIVTSIGAESTARNAYDYGYKVAFVIDAMTDRDLEAHNNSVEKIFPGIGETDMAEHVQQLLGELR